MGTRRRARESALRLLYQEEYHSGSLEPRLSAYWTKFPHSAEAKLFALQLVEGVIEHREEIDALIAKHAFHWRLDRMSHIDRNILRAAIYEMRFVPQTPLKVVVNEAIEIAKRYGSEESGAFVNGILDAVLGSQTEGQ